MIKSKSFVVRVNVTSFLCAVNFVFSSVQILFVNGLMSVINEHLGKRHVNNREIRSVCVCVSLVKLVNFCHVEMSVYNRAQKLL